MIGPVRDILNNSASSFIQMPPNSQLAPANAFATVGMPNIGGLLGVGGNDPFSNLCNSMWPSMNHELQSAMTTPTLWASSGTGFLGGITDNISGLIKAAQNCIALKGTCAPTNTQEQAPSTGSISPASSASTSNVSVTTTTNPNALNLAESAEKHAGNKATSSSRCYEIAANAIEEVMGKFLSGGQAHMAAPILMQDSRFVEMPANTPRQPGDIVVYGPKKDPKASNAAAGHIAVIGRDGIERSDFKGCVNPDIYSWVRVFRLKENPSSGIA
ncbi:MAG: hypothetical protein VKK59_02900 [Vampirovibrionales bacterium]|nr:hypothetical protein [Vampirovibrionales bacterium]